MVNNPTVKMNIGVSAPDPHITFRGFILSNETAGSHGNSV